MNFVRVVKSRWAGVTAGAHRHTTSLFHPPDAGKMEGFLEAQKWSLDYSPPREGDEYDLVLDYAKGRYEEMLGISEALDKKLDDVARTSLAIGVLIATVARFLGTETPFGRSSFLMPAALSFALAVVLAVLSRRPMTFRTPLEMRDLLKLMDEHPEITAGKAKALISTSYHVAMVGTYATNTWKADQLRRATWLLVIGVILLLVILIFSPAAPEFRGR